MLVLKQDILIPGEEIINSCKKAGLPTPEIIETAGGIKVTLFKGDGNTLQVTPQVEKLSGEENALKTSEKELTADDYGRLRTITND